MRVIKYIRNALMLLLLAGICVTNYSRSSLKTFERSSHNGLRRLEWHTEPGQQYIEILERSTDTEDAFVRLKYFSRPGVEGFYPNKSGSIPSYSHGAEEWQVVQGHFAYSLNGTEGEAFAGHHIDIPAGIGHSFWNAGSDAGLDLELLVTLTPGTCNGHDCALFYENLAGLSRDYGGLSKVNLIQLLGLMHEHRHEFIDIPAPIRPYAMAAAQRIARILGFRWSYDEYESKGSTARDESGSLKGSGRFDEDDIDAAIHTEL